MRANALIFELPFGFLAFLANNSKKNVFGNGF